jgi:hypothetical protein
MRLFLSYKWEDRAYLNGFTGLLNNSNNNYRHIGIHERANLHDQPEEVWKPEIRALMDGCDALICLIGQDTHSATGVKYELEVAISWEKLIIPIRIPNTNSGLPKKFLIRLQN